MSVAFTCITRGRLVLQLVCSKVTQIHRTPLIRYTSYTTMSEPPKTVEKGVFKREESKFRNWIKADGSTDFKPEADRYHLYVSLACPWASRCLIGRSMKGLDDIISVTVVDWFNDERGWSFTDKRPKCTLDTVNGKNFIREIYLLADPEYTGRNTVPVLWDKKKSTVVSNESSEILRMFNSEFNAFCKTDEQKAIDLYPEPLRKQIDDANDWIYPSINNGVYKAGFARTQEAYNEGVAGVFEGLDKMEKILSKQRYVTGNKFTEADVRLFTTLIRFDPVYVGHFKCNIRMIRDYENIWAFTRELYQMPAIQKTVDFQHIKEHYYGSHIWVNPTGVVPSGPKLDYDVPHGRDKKFPLK